MKIKSSIQAFFVLFALFIYASVTHAGEGLILKKSAFDVATTTDRLESLLKSKGMTIFNRIDHAQNANRVNKSLRPTQLIIFGNPKIGTLLMQCQPTVAIDLPQKMLIWEDQKNQVWLSYNSPDYLRARHELKGCDISLKKISKALDLFATKATTQ